MTCVLVTGGAWWAGDGEPADPPLAAGPAAPGRAAAGAAAGAPTAVDHKAKPRALPKATPPPRPTPPPPPLTRSRPTALEVPAITIEVS